MRQVGPAVVDVPGALVAQLGGRRQYRVRGTIDGHEFSGSTMLVTGGGICVGVSGSALKEASAAVGQEVDVALTRRD